MSKPTLQGVVFDFWGVLVGVSGSWSHEPAILELIDELRGREIRLALLSNGGGSKTRLVERFPFLAPFDAIFLSGEVGAPKPYRQAFLNVEHTLGLPGEALLLVDDSAVNVSAARQYGWQAHHFQDVPALRAELVAWGLLADRNNV
jgi:HAD superfamily hydrolase (TIGR01509 family)